MLRKRSIAPTTNKQSFMSDHKSIPTPSPITNRRTSSFLTSPRSFSGFSMMGLSDPAISPTSTLETKPFTTMVDPFFAERSKDKPVMVNKEHNHVLGSGESGPIGLGLVDALKDNENRKVLFGSQLKIQIPPAIHRPVSPSGSIESPRSPVEFGIKTMNLHTGSLSSSCLANEGLALPCIVDDLLSASEMELSEDYTRVITHGPNPKTTHIFDNRTVESCGDSPVCLSDIFSKFCSNCGKKLGQSKDIFMYRDEKAFCSRECRFTEMSNNDDKVEKQQEEVR